jgi:hypothetical protein
MTNQIHSAAAKGFQAGPDAYERGRPEYPEKFYTQLKDFLNE